MAWLNPGRWLAVLLVLVSLYIGHALDKRAAVAKAIAVTKAQATQAALVQSEINRTKEQALIVANEKVRHDYAKQKAINSALARSNADRLRDYQAASDRVTTSDTASTSGTPSPFAAIAGECTAALTALDGHAQGLRATAAALQDFAANVRLK